MVIFCLVLVRWSVWGFLLLFFIFMFLALLVWLMLFFWSIGFSSGWSLSKVRRTVLTKEMSPKLATKKPPRWKANNPSTNVTETVQQCNKHHDSEFFLFYILTALRNVTANAVWCVNYRLTPGYDTEPSQTKPSKPPSFTWCSVVNSLLALIHNLKLILWLGWLIFYIWRNHRNNEH